MTVAISVVIPVYNAARYLDRCIEGLLSQTLARDQYEILMIDNNSTDGSDRIIEGFGGVRLLKEPEQGSYAARNRGLREASGGIVVFTDPDCVPETDWLEQMQRALSEPGVGVVLGGRRFATDTGALGMLSAYEEAIAARIFGTQSIRSYYGYTNNMAVRMSIVRELDGFEHRMRGADSIFLRRAVELHGPSILRYVPGAVVRHLEIESIRDYLEKKAVYGKVNHDPATATPQPLPLAARLELAMSARPSGGGSMAESMRFWGTLALGAALFEWKRWKGNR